MGCEKDIPVQYIDNNFNPNTLNIEIPSGFPYVNQNLDLPEEGVMLGRKLFYEKKLSQNNQMSCASCHIQEFGFSNGTRYSVGVSRISKNSNIFCSVM